MVNIRDVARKSGHSVSTVSRVLNHKGPVSSKTKAEIEAVIVELDYHRNDLARELSLGKTQRIGVILPYINHPYFQKLANAITEIAFMNHYLVTLLPTNYDQDRERQYLDLLKHRSFDGLIFTSRALGFHEILPYRDYGPIICCEDTFDYPLACAFTNRGESFVQVFQLLKVQGFTKTGVTVSRNELVSQSAKLTLKAYEIVFGRPIPDDLIFRDAKNTFDGISAADQFLQADAGLQAIFANGDEIAGGAAMKLNTLSNSTPLVVGQENLPTSFLMDFSTLDHQLTDIGDAAFELLFKEHPVKKQIPANFIARGLLKETAHKKAERQDQIDQLLR